MTRSPDLLLRIFETESAQLSAMLRSNPRLAPLFREEPLVDASAYLQLLKLTADYVQFTVPALHDAALVLQRGNDEELAWGHRLLSNAREETDKDDGHHAWAIADLSRIDPRSHLLDAPTHPAAVLYGQFFIDDVEAHPLAILGAKGVLEHLSLLVSDALARGVLASGIPGAEHAASFFQHHGTLDVDHVLRGDACVARIEDPSQRRQVAQGAYFASGTYRTLVDAMLTTEPLE